MGPHGYPGTRDRGMAERWWLIIFLVSQTIRNTFDDDNGNVRPNSRMPTTNYYPQRMQWIEPSGVVSRNRRCTFACCSFSVSQRKYHLCTDQIELLYVLCYTVITSYYVSCRIRNNRTQTSRVISYGFHKKKLQIFLRFKNNLWISTVSA